MAGIIATVLIRFVIAWLLGSLGLIVASKIFADIRLVRYQTAFIAAFWILVSNRLILWIAANLHASAMWVSIGMGVIGNPLLILLTARYVKGFSVKNYWYALVAALVMVFVGWAINPLR